MDKVYKDHITSNIVKLINCTDNPDTWYTHLVPYGFISHSTWETINKREGATDSILREMYFACMKTPKYDDLIESLKSCENNLAAKILEEVYGNNTVAASAILPAQDFTDFQVATKHAYAITKEIQNANIGYSDWHQIMEDLLPNHMKQDIMKEDKLSYKIQKTINAWISVSTKENRTFSKLIDVIRRHDHVQICETLEMKSAEFCTLQ